MSPASCRDFNSYVNFLGFTKWGLPELDFFQHIRCPSFIGKFWGGPKGTWGSFAAGLQALHLPCTRPLRSLGGGESTDGPARWHDTGRVAGAHAWGLNGKEGGSNMGPQSNA